METKGHGGLHEEDLSVAVITALAQVVTDAVTFALLKAEYKLAAVEQDMF